METVIQAMTDGVQDAVPERQSQETEEGNVLESVFGGGGKAKKRRIMYTKDFLVDCFSHPACSRCPTYADFSMLDCTLTSARLKDLSKAIFDPLRQKELSARKDNEDNISLRPQSGNFSSGCAPSLSPAVHSFNNHNRFPFHSDDQPKNSFGRGFNRPRFNHNNPRQDMNDTRYRSDREFDLPLRERDKMDWDRDRERDRNIRGRDQHHPRRQNTVLFGPESDSHNDYDWTRPRATGFQNNGNNSRMRGGHSYGGNRYGRDRDEDEPEWFSGGPKSQHETIELHGFQDDERRNPNVAKKENPPPPKREETESVSQNGTAPQVNSTAGDTRQEQANTMDLSLEKILQMDHISGILPNGLLEEIEPTGSSRFRDIFQRNSEDAQSKAQISTEKMSEEAIKLQDLFAPRSDTSSEGPSKSTNCKAIESELRRVLLGGTDKDQQQEQPKAEPPKQEDLQAIQKLLSQLMSKSTSSSDNGPQLDGPSNRNSGNGPPPGLQGMLSSFGLSNVSQPQTRPQQAIPHHVRPTAVNHSMGNPPIIPAMNPLARLLEQPQYQDVPPQNPKRSSTPINTLAAFTPTSVMRKMTGDQQGKAPPPVSQGPAVTSYGGMSQVDGGPGSNFNSSNNMSNNALASFMRCVSQQSHPNHTPHILQQLSQAQLPPLPPAAHHHMHHMQGPVHGPPHPGGYPVPPPQQRMQYPVMVGPPPNAAAMRAPFPPFVTYGAQMPPRK